MSVYLADLLHSPQGHCPVSPHITVVDHQICLVGEAADKDVTHSGLPLACFALSRHYVTAGSTCINILKYMYDMPSGAGGGGAF